MSNSDELFYVQKKYNKGAYQVVDYNFQYRFQKNLIKLNMFVRLIS